MRLVILPFAGGNRYSLGFIRDLLPETVEFVPLEPPGRGMRMYEPLLSSVRELADDIFIQLQQLEEDNYVLLGDCVGALLAFAVTRKLVRANKSLPTRLLVSGCPAPALFRVKRNTVMEESEMKERLIQFGTDPALLEHKGFYEMIEPIMRSDFRAFNEYIYADESPLSLPIAVLADKQSIRANETTLWQYETTFPLVTVEIPGTLKNSTAELSFLFQEMFAGAYAD